MTQKDRSAPAANGIVGVWRLEGAVWSADDGSTWLPYGEKPDGLLFYDSAGWMSVSMMAANRADFDPPRESALDFERGSPAEVREAFNTYHAYCGRYELDLAECRVTHHIVGGLVPSYAGTSLVRTYELDGDFLTLRHPGMAHADGIPRGGRVSWKRVG